MFHQASINILIYLIVESFDSLPFGALASLIHKNDFFISVFVTLTVQVETELHNSSEVPRCAVTCWDAGKCSSRYIVRARRCK